MTTTQTQERLYHLQAVNERSGRVVRLTGYPMNHAQCCTMKGKFTPHKDVRIELTEHRELAA